MLFKHCLPHFEMDECDLKMITKRDLSLNRSDKAHLPPVKSHHIIARAVKK